jgi:hypothetical protein
MGKMIIDVERETPAVFPIPIPKGADGRSDREIYWVNPM